jgi:ADP-ribose pyrophosphatase YjhB (NUDIX family)
MSRVMYSGRFIRIEEEEIGGYTFEKAYLKDSLIIIPFIDRERLLLIEERRIHEDVKVRLKPIGGFFEQGYSLAENANRELQEEIGMKAGRIVPYVTARRSGTLNDTVHLVLAFDLIEAPVPNPDPNEEILAVVPVSVAEAYQMALAGRFGMGYSGYFVLKLWHDWQAGRIGPGMAAIEL